MFLSQLIMLIIKNIKIITKNKRDNEKKKKDTRNQFI